MSSLEANINLQQPSKLQTWCIAFALVLVLTGCTGLSSALADLRKTPSDDPQFLEGELAFNLQPLQNEINLVAAAKTQGAKRLNTLEYPSPAHPYLSAPDVRAISGGRGEGLSCSLPPLVSEIIFTPPKTAGNAGRAAPIGLHFRQACVTHDYCYRHGAATYGYRQTDCDLMLYDEAFRLCYAIYKQASNEENPATDYCTREAKLVLWGVNMFGFKAFQREGASTYFEFDPLARARRTYRQAPADQNPHQGFSVARMMRGKTNEPLTKYVFAIDEEWKVSSAKPNSGSQSLPASWTFSKMMDSQIDLPPPQLPIFANLQGELRLWLIERQSARYTGMRVYTFDPVKPQIVALQGNGRNTHYECNSPINLPFALSDNSTSILVAGVAVSTPEPTKLCRDSLLHRDAAIALQGVPFRSFLKSNFYRLAQHSPLYGRFQVDAAEPQFAFLGRGHYGQPSEKTETHKQRSDQGEGYQQNAALFTMITENSFKRTETDIEEDDEPVVPMRIAPWGAQDALVSIRKSPAGNVCLKLWNPALNLTASKAEDTNFRLKTPCVDVSEMAGGRALDSSWITIPPQIVRVGDQDVVLLTRTCVLQGEKCRPAQPIFSSFAGTQPPPDWVQLDALALRVVKTNKDEQKSGSLPASRITQVAVSVVEANPANKIDLQPYLARTSKLNVEHASTLGKIFLKKLENCPPAATSTTCENVRTEASHHWLHAQSLASVEHSEPAVIAAHFAPHPFAASEWKTLLLPIPK
jgi:hypothetical protein